MQPVHSNVDKWLTFSWTILLPNWSCRQTGRWVIVLKEPNWEKYRPKALERSIAPKPKNRSPSPSRERKAFEIRSRAVNDDRRKVKVARSVPTADNGFVACLYRSGMPFQVQQHQEQHIGAVSLPLLRYIARCAIYATDNNKKGKILGNWSFSSHFPSVSFFETVNDHLQDAAIVSEL